LGEPPTVRVVRSVEIVRQGANSGRELPQW
jgi:hypothetical protein